MIGADKNRELTLMVFWQGGECLVQRRTHDKDGIGFFGGRVNDGEPPLDAGIREVQEEISKEFASDLATYDITELEAIKDDGWLINGFQVALASDLKVVAREGEAVRMTPMDMWRHPKLMPATRAVLSKHIMDPNGIIDN